MNREDFIKIFIQETEDHITNFRDSLLTLEQDSSNKNILDSLFRSAHSLKGAANAMGFSDISTVSHAVEDLMDLFRKGEAVISSENVTLLLQFTDFLEDFLAKLKDGDEPSIDTTEMTNIIRSQFEAIKSGASTDISEDIILPNEITIEEDDDEPGESPLGDLMNSSMISDFVDEAQEHIRNLNSDLLELEEAGENASPELINSAFRAIHTIKGVSGMLGLAKIADLSHELENLLNELRYERMKVSVEIANVLFEGLDVLSELIEKVAMGQKMDTNVKPTIAKVIAIMGKEETQTAVSSPAPKKTSQASAAPPPKPSPKTDSTHTDQQKVNDLKKEGKFFYEITFKMQHDCVDQGKNPVDIIKELDSIGTVISSYTHIDQVPELENITTSDLDLDVVIVAATVVSLDILQVAVTMDNAQYKELNSDEEIFAALNKAYELAEKIKSAKNTKKIKLVEPTVVQKTEEPKPKVTKQETPKQEAQPSPPKFTKQRDTIIMRKDSASQTVRVDATKLDQILSQVGELVVVRARYAHAARRSVELLRHRLMRDRHDLNKKEAAQYSSISEEEFLDEQRRTVELNSHFDSIDSDLARLLSDLQDSVMSARMVPIGNVFSKYKRLVRDLTTSLGKELRLELVGEETELDKKVIDEIGDPLTHLVRNCADHGIESSEDRVKAGKMKQGTITLRAFHQGDCIMIEVEDDGAGLNREKIAQKAIKKGIISSERAENMPDREIYRMILEPGFSTAAKVTDLSGRGVGMDVVQNTLEKLKGSLDIDSEFGRGTKFTIKLPLTLAIIDALLVKVEMETYAIPIASVREILEIETESVRIVEHQECVPLEDRNLPLIRLRDILDVPGENDDVNMQGRLFTVITESPVGQVGIVVQEIIGQQEIVIKALSQRFEDVRGISGASILGDGKVCLILDVSAIVDLVVKARARGASIRKKVTV